VVGVAVLARADHPANSHMKPCLTTDIKPTEGLDCGKGLGGAVTLKLHLKGSGFSSKMRNLMNDKAWDRGLNYVPKTKITFINIPMYVSRFLPQPMLK
jgi:hypothetical protein